MKITLNGEEINLAPNLTIHELLALQGLNTHKIASELNKQLIPRSQYHATQLEEDNTLEIVHAIGGG